MGMDRNTIIGFVMGLLCLLTYSFPQKIARNTKTEITLRRFRGTR
jgi:hypothetical protein